MWKRGELSTLLRWLEALPEQVMHAHPRLLLDHAWVLGITFALLLLALSLIQLLTGRMSLLGASGIVYTLILTTLGLTQTGLLVGPMHWLIQTVHVVIGFGALMLVQVISVCDARLRRSAASVPMPRATAPRAVR